MKPYIALLALAAFLSGCENNDLHEPEKPTRLKSVTTHFKNQAGEFKPSDKTVYKYDSKRTLSSKEYLIYDVLESKFTLFSTTTFTFKNNLSEKIVESITGTNLVKTTTFHYTNDVLTSVHVDDEIDADITIEHPQVDKTEAVYTFSNGRWFTYRFSSLSNNIVKEQTFDESNNLASEVTHEYDNGINPYNLLGYTDALFRNYSGHNKTKTESEYYAIGFPQSVPVSYEYIYNDKNLPLEQIITYKSYPNGDAASQMKVVFEYE